MTRSPQVVKELITEANLKFDAELPDFNGASLGSRRKLSAVMKRLDRVGDEILDSSNQTQRSIWLEKQMRLQTEKVAFEAELKELEIRKTAGRNEKLDSDKIQTAFDLFFLGFIKLPIAARQSFLSSLLVRVVVEKDELKIEITNPGFSMSYESEDSVNLSGQKFAQWDEWLPRRSNVRTELHSVATH
ncbi:MAG: hypothetical protein NTV34_17685 [Proteobacteria bacterium]|nr:hypothetical protein [Pseudomonadota bacterium]